MGCQREKVLGLLLRLRSELKCREDRALLDVYIEKIEELLAAEAEAELWR